MIELSEVRRTPKVDTLLRWLREHPDRSFELLGRTPSAQQRQLLDDLAKDFHNCLTLGRGHADVYTQYAIASGQGTGKTATVAGAATWNACKAPMNRSVVLAPTMETFSQGLLAELRTAVINGPSFLREMFSFYKDRVRMFNVTGWEIIGRTSGNPIALQGIHNEYLGVFGDEASGLDDMSLEVFKGTLSNPYPLLMLTGNPNRATGPFHDAVFTDKMAGDWRRYRWTSLDSPFADTERDEMLRREYGEQSDIYRVRVLGLPPLADRDAVLRSSTIEEAMCRADSAEIMGGSWAETVPLEGYEHPIQIGLDLARSATGDESVIAVRHNSKVTFEAYLGWEPLAVVQRAFEIQREMGAADSDVLYVVDADGLGQGVLGAFYASGKTVHEFHTSSASFRGDFSNAMTEAWFDMRDLLQAHGADGTAAALELPRDTRLAEQLRSRKFKMLPSNKIALESKREHLTHSGGSPDRADAVAYCCARLAGGIRSRILSANHHNPYHTNP